MNTTHALWIATTLLLTSQSASADILVASAGANRIFRFDQVTGAFVSASDPTSAGYATTMAFSQDGYLYVGSSDATTGFNSHIDRFDPATGNRLFSFGALPQTRGMTIGPDGLVYVSAFLINQIWRYNPATGAFIDVFVASVVPGGCNFCGIGAGQMTFGPDGNLYVCVENVDAVFKFNGTTGAPLAKFITEPGLLPGSIAFGPDGNIYLGTHGGAYTNQIRRYLGSTGAFDKVFATSASLLETSSLAFGPDGNLYVGSSLNASVLRFNGTTGAFVDTFIPPGFGGMGTNLTGIVFTGNSVTTTYDAVSDFSIASNPAGNWSYGYKAGLGGTFQLHNSAQVEVVPGIDRWYSPGIDPYALGVRHNKTGSTITGSPATFIYPPDMLHMHPTIPNYYTVVRWTAPQAGQYNLQGLYSGLDFVTSVADTDVHVLLNSTTELMPAVVLHGYGTSTPIAITRTLNAGDTIDFAVGIGPSGSIANDSTGLAVRITSSITPTSFTPVDTTTGTTPVTITFSSITQPGTTTLTTNSIGSEPPTGFELGNPAVYYNLSTTTIFSGSALVCINYSGVNFSDPGTLQLFHYENGAWADVTTSVNTATSTICGSVTSFSPFAVFQSSYKAAVQQPINANGSSVFKANRGVVPVKFTLTLKGAATCQLPPARIALTRTAGSTVGPINESDFLQASDSGANFRIEGCQYAYNLGTGSLGPGTYKVQIQIGPVPVGSAVFGLE